MLFNQKFDLILSLGEDCACTSYLRRFNLQDFSYPFDWLTKADFEKRTEMIVNNFNDFLSKDNLVLMQKPNGNVDKQHDYYKDNKHDFYFYHDFKINIPFEHSYSEVKEKYQRRIQRLYSQIEKAGSILFVWWSRNKHQSKDAVISCFKQLKTKFNNKNIYLLLIKFSETEEQYTYEDRHILIVRYDNISYKHNPKWTEVMGNENNNSKIFSEIKRQRKAKWYINMICYNLVKIFIECMPNRNMKRNLREKWHYKFYRDKL